MHLPGLVLFFMLLGPSMAVANSFGVFLVQTPNASTPGISAIFAPLGCSGGPGTGITLTCALNLGIPALIFGVALTFGYFIWGLVVVTMFVSAIQLPYDYMVYWGVPAVVAFVYFIAVAFSLLMWVYTLVTSRYNQQID